MLSNLASFDARRTPSERALLERLDALARLGPERAQAWSELFSLPGDMLDGLAAALELWLHLRRGLPRPDAPTVPLFQLLVARWAQAERCAFEQAERRYTFAELELLTAARAELWSAAGVAPKKVVALGRKAGVELLLDVLAVVRLGACACWVPPLGEPFERAALQLAAPDFCVAVDPVAATSVPKAPLLEDTPQPAAGARARAVAAGYAPKDAVLLIISPISGGSGPAALGAPTALTAGQMLRALARDAAFVWCLRDGDRVAAPGVCAWRYQPLLALATILAGACFHFASDEADARPEAELRGPYRTLGVTAKLRDVLLQQPPRVRCDLWFRELEGGEASLEWRRLKRAAWGAGASQALAFDPGLGGVSLLAPSDPEREVTADEGAALEAPCFPSLAEKWAIAPLPGAAPGEPVGLLGLEVPGSAAPYLLVRARDGGSVAYLGSVGARRAGRVFPGGITCAAVTHLPGVLGATLLAVPGASPDHPWRFGLLVFVAASAGSWNAHRADAVETVLTRHVRCVLATELRPDFVQVLPIQPQRGAHGVVDAAWAGAQRWSGGLLERSQRDLFRQMVFVSDPSVG